MIISGDRVFFEMFQFTNFRHTGLLLPKGNYIYTFIHVIDSIPCRTSHIEYKSPGKIHHFFKWTPPNSIGFHGKVFFHSSATPVVGGTLRWASKIHFFLKYKKTLIISGDIKNFIFRYQPWKSVKDHENQGKIHPFLRNVTYFHWFSLQLQSSFYHCSTTPVVGGTLGWA